MDNLFSTNHELITKSEKEKLLKQKGICLWLTGLSGSGKTSIAKALAKKLHSKGFITKVLDGDNIRLGINKNLTLFNSKFILLLIFKISVLIFLLNFSVSIPKTLK